MCGNLLQPESSLSLKVSVLEGAGQQKPGRTDGAKLAWAHLTASSGSALCLWSPLGALVMTSQGDAVSCPSQWEEEPREGVATSQGKQLTSASS